MDYTRNLKIDICFGSSPFSNEDYICFNVSHYWTVGNIYSFSASKETYNILVDILKEYIDKEKIRMTLFDDESGFTMVSLDGEMRVGCSVKI